VADTKLNISKAYLRPGGAFGGSCLPKDVRALQYIAGQVGADTHLINALIQSNQAHKDHLFDRCAQGLAPGAAVLMLGLAFKSKSDDLRESPNVDLARAFIDAGYDLTIFDPYVNPANFVGQNLGTLSNSPFVRGRLVSQAEMEGGTYALVVDCHGIRDRYHIAATRFFDVNALA
jgi:GDP-mannose 6-dehydrogenase